MGLGQLAGARTDETPREEYEAIDENLVQRLFEQEARANPVSIHAADRKIQLIETIRWYLAYDDVLTGETRRRDAQKQVAEDHSITVQAVQNKVREAYDGLYGRKTAQELFEEDIERIETRYWAAMEAR